jgi:hypothetical protein
LNEKVVSLESTFEKKEEEFKAGQMAVPLHRHGVCGNVGRFLGWALCRVFEP